MKPVWSLGTLNDAVKLWQSDKLLLVMAGDELGPDITDLIGQCSDALFNKYHYLDVHAGLLSDGRGLVVCKWSGSGSGNLEKRWLFQKAVEVLKKQFSLEKWLVFLSEGSTSLQEVMSEDLYFSGLRSFKNENHLKSIEIISAKKRSLRDQSRFEGGEAFRQWVNENPDDLTSTEMSRRLKKFAGDYGCDFNDLSSSTLKEDGCNLLLAVGGASELSPPRLIVVTKNIEAGDKPLTLIGKGITFDTGGINVKPFDSFVNCMKNDMGGAGLMANLFMSLVKAGYDKPLALLVPACENLVAQGAMKPGAVVTSRSGKQVFIEHTDAEGRLILADAIDYACEKLDPSMIWTAATLTTAALRQFSGYFTPVHFGSAELNRKLDATGGKWGEGFRFWSEFLPFKDANNTSAGDLTNMGRLPAKAAMGSGSNIAAHFLKSFSKAPIVHFDIFASAWNWSSDYPGAGYGATGAAFNTLYEVLMDGL